MAYITPLHTVKVTFSGFDQANMSANGKLCLKLNEPVIVGNTIVVADSWSEADFSNATGKAVLEVVPNDLIGGNSYYEYKIMVQGSACMKTVQHGYAYIPNRDCDFIDTIVEAYPGPIPPDHRAERRSQFVPAPMPHITNKQEERYMHQHPPIDTNSLNPTSTMIQAKLARDAAVAAQLEAEHAAMIAVQAKNMQNSSIDKINNYLYSVVYDDIDYDYAYHHFVKLIPGNVVPILPPSHPLGMPSNPGNTPMPAPHPHKPRMLHPHNGGYGCSSIRFGGLVGRNFDGPYSEEVEFVVRTKAGRGRYAVVGVSSGLGITRIDVEDRTFMEKFRDVPFYIVDGINEHGLNAVMHHMPGMDNAATTGTHTDALESVCNRMLVRYILDNYKSAKVAAEAVRDNINVYSIGEEYSFMLSDASSTYLIEFINNSAVIYDITNNLPYLTNFYRTYAGLNADGTLNTTVMTAHSGGVERFNLISQSISTLTGKEALYDLLRAIRMSVMYDQLTNPVWKSDFLMGSFTINTPISSMLGAINGKRIAFANRDRDGVTLHTMHCSMYDMTTKSLFLYNQEEETPYICSLSNMQLGDLATDNKTSIIAAINELVAKVKDLDDRVVFIDEIINP